MRKLFWMASLLVGCAATPEADNKEVVIGGGEDAISDEQRLDCGLESSLRSEKFDTATRIEFANTSNGERRVYWLDYDGRRVLYQTLAPGAAYTQQTYVTHPWVMTDAADECVAIRLPAEEELRVEIP